MEMGWMTIIDGKQTFTFKRIDSTTKILELEKKLVYEKKNLNIENKKSKLEKSLNEYNKKLKLSEELSNELNSKFSTQSFLNDADKQFFIMNNIYVKLEEEIKILKKNN